MKRSKGFTLVEILIVLAIIGILAAILFPVLKSAREKGNQTSCITNLHQIGLALALYYQDEKHYPSSLAYLLPADANLDAGGGATVQNTNGTAYLGSSKNLMCPDDDKDDSLRSSYGDISTSLPTTTDATTYQAPNDPSVMSRYVWNYYGYDQNGVAYGSAAQANTAAVAMGVGVSAYLFNPAVTTYSEKSNPFKYSLSNKYAPPDTIVTHCVFHRTQTSDAGDPNVVAPGERDIVLRVDGAARSVDVSSYGDLTTASNWLKQTG